MILSCSHEKKRQVVEVYFLFHAFKGKAMQELPAKTKEGKGCKSRGEASSRIEIWLCTMRCRFV